VLVLGVIAFGLFVPLGTMHWDGGYPTAEFRFAITDGSGAPLEGVRLEVEGYTMPIIVFQVVGGDVVELEGSWPVFELGREELKSDGSGKLSFRQLMDGIQFGGTRSLYLFRGWVRHGPDECHDCVLSKEGFESVRVSFGDLAKRYYALEESAECVAAPGLYGETHYELAVIPVPVAMRRTSN
jgi:hypothetical protein